VRAEAKDNARHRRANNRAGHLVLNGIDALADIKDLSLGFGQLVDDLCLEFLVKLENFQPGFTNFHLSLSYGRLVICNFTLSTGYIALHLAQTNLIDKTL